MKTDITNVIRSNQDEAKHRAAPQTAAAAGGRERIDRGRGTLLDRAAVETGLYHRIDHETDERQT